MRVWSHGKSRRLPGVVAGSLIALGMLAPTWPARAEEPAGADNTGVNKRDRQQAEPTADQGKNNASDLELARKIRRSIVSDKALSMDAHNVKIIAEHGLVTLRGPVRTQTEKTTIENKAVDVAGQSKVKNELDVKP